MDDKGLARVLIRFFGVFLIAYGLIGAFFSIIYITALNANFPDWLLQANASSFTTTLFVFPLELIAGFIFLIKSEALSDKLIKKK